MSGEVQTFDGVDPTEQGQALLEMVFILPFILLVIMVVAEFGIYFYRVNLIENTAQTMGRLAARGSTKTELETYMNTQMSKLSPALTVKNTSGTTITTWTSDAAIELTVTVTAVPVMPVGALNAFAGGVSLFPTSFTLKSVKTVYVE